MMIPITQFSPYTSLFGFIIGFPTMVAAYYQSWRARQEARLAREGIIHSLHCLEFVMEDGTCVMETLHTLPKPGDVVLLPGDGIGKDGGIDPGRIGSTESSISTPLPPGRPGGHGKLG